MNNSIRSIFATFLILFSFIAQADAVDEFLAKVEIKSYSAQEIAAASQDYGIPVGQILAPIADYQPVGLLAMSGSTPYDSLAMKITLIANMPVDVPIVVYGPKRELKDTFDSVTRSSGEIKFIRIEDPLTREAGYEEWTADHLGYPVWIKGHGDSPRVGLVQAQYRWGYDPNPEFSRYLLTPILYQIQDFIEFGNMVINAAKKTAYVVASPRLRNVPNEVFLSTGITRVVRIPHLTRIDKEGKSYPVGIGHVDERIVFVSDNLVLVDSPEFAELMKREGYEVRMLPSFKEKEYQYRSYTNSRLVNGTAFVPTFGDAMDEVAIKVYETAGLKVVPIRAVLTSDIGHGNVHCLTRTLPQLPNGEKYQFLEFSMEGPY